MKVSEFFKGMAMIVVGLPVMALVGWFEDLQDKERLRVINAKRKKNGDPPFATLWEYYRESRDWDERHH
jgi:hypothetical protein